MSRKRTWIHQGIAHAAVADVKSAHTLIPVSAAMMTCITGPCAMLREAKYDRSEPDNRSDHDFGP